MADALFGPMVSFYDVETGLVSHMDTWASKYLAGRERKWGLVAGSTARPRSWIIRQTFDALPGEDQTPAVVVVSGTTEDVTSHGDRGIDVDLNMAVAILCHGSESKAARELAGHYQAAFLNMLLQKPKFAVGPSDARIEEWSGFSIEDVPEDQTRTLCAVRLNFTVCVQNFAISAGGPPTAANPLAPVADGPTVITHGATTEVLP